MAAADYPQALCGQSATINRAVFRFVRLSLGFVRACSESGLESGM